MTGVARLQVDQRQWQERFDDFLMNGDLTVKYDESTGGVFLQRALPQNLSTSRGPHYVQCFVKPQGRDGIHARMFTYRPNIDLDSSEPEISVYDISLGGGTQSVQIGTVPAKSFEVIRTAWRNMDSQLANIKGLKRLHHLNDVDWSAFNGALDAIFWKPEANPKLYSDIMGKTKMDEREATEFVDFMLRLKLPEEPGKAPESAQFFDAKRYSSK